MKGEIMRRIGTMSYVLAALSLLLFAVQLLVGPEWIERLSALEPDGGDGSLEALLVVAPGLSALAFGIFGRFAFSAAAKAT